MSLTATKLIEAITEPPSQSQNGKLMALQRSLPHSDILTARLLEELMARDVPAREKYVHPADGVGMEYAPSAGGAVVKHSPLPAADIAWLERLPRDPAQITHEDARELAAMALRVKPASGDARLVRSIWAGVDRLHSKRAAEVELRNLQAATPPRLPRDAASRVIGAVLAEAPQLTTEEALTRADRLLQDAVTAREAQRVDRIAEAKAQIAEFTGPPPGVSLAAAS